MNETVGFGYVISLFRWQLGLRQTLIGDWAGGKQISAMHPQEPRNLKVTRKLALP